MKKILLSVLVTMVTQFSYAGNNVIIVRELFDHQQQTEVEIRAKYFSKTLMVYTSDCKNTLLRIKGEII